LHQKKAGVLEDQVIRMRSQSGQIQVGPLDIPHKFSLKHSSQIINPQGQLRQYGNSFLQQ
jgi:hypothetical protein